MNKPRARRRLPPHQYVLRFPPFNDWEVPPRQRRHGYLGGPYIVRRGDMWMAYRSRYKAQSEYTYAMSAPSLPELTRRIAKSRDWRLGCSRIPATSR